MIGQRATAWHSAGEPLTTKNQEPSGELSGLTEEQARQRLALDGPNELPAEKPRTVLAIALEVTREPMFLMLVGAGALYLATGELGDALMLLGFVLVVMAITIVQERRTERALDALRDLSSPRALVVRGGAQRRIAGREVVRGDLVVLSEGDRAPADGLLRRGAGLMVDESLLTGESVPVRKVARRDGELERPGGDDLASVFSGTLVTAGQGHVEILQTGARSELGKIGRSLQTVAQEASPLQRETRRLVRLFAGVGLMACAGVVVVYSLTRGGALESWRQGFLAGIALAMAILPEELPVILTVFLALGAWRITRSRVLTRRMPAIEALGAATVLCVDKTGTLTQNRMVLRELSTSEGAVELRGVPGSLEPAPRQVLETAILASRPDPFDPMERALHEAAVWLGGAAATGEGYSLIKEYALSPELLTVTQVWAAPEGPLRLAAKGAPEAIAELCRLDEGARAALAAAVTELAGKGLRVLGVARGQAERGTLPEAQRELRLELLGLLGLEDPLRDTVPAAVAECRAAGIRVVMITGDYPGTAKAIAHQAGIDGSSLLTGAELERLSAQELTRRIAEVGVFARVVPEQKLRIVEALKAAGEVVAMTGDGVNDAPALRSAHIGIAMGNRGTDVAREAAALVLLDDDFSSIVAAVRLGRRIFDNIKKSIAFVLAVHVPIAGLSILPVFFASWPLLLLPVHIVFLELIIDPSCSLVFEAEESEADVMARPPRRADERLFSWATLRMSVLQGASVLAACVGVFLMARDGRSDDSARALAFSTLVVSFVMIILVNRSWTQTAWAMLKVPNTALRWVLWGTGAMLALVLLLPAARELFHFAAVPAGALGPSLGAGVLAVLWYELVKLRRQGTARRARAGARSPG